jgi:DNA gyrase subunit A
MTDEEDIGPISTEEPQEEISKIIPQVIEQEMKEAYLSYAMSVIIGRALPDIRDGLKPVQRRIMYAMHDMGMLHNKPFKKCARIVGECLGKYHPHGDQAVYDALVRMAQEFSLRYPLVDGQGNFGSVDGDNAASMRYTEARLQKAAEELLKDIEKDTVLFTDNFDGSLKEPSVLPTRLPALLVNGATGIAVGMATNIPPHNLREIGEGVIKLVENPETTVTELMEIITGPDFPTGGTIVGRMGVVQALKTGRGKVKVRAKHHLEDKKGRRVIIIDEIPYMVGKGQLLQQIARCVKDKVIEGISDLRDESDRDGMRVVIELKKEANEEVTINQLFKYSRLQTTFGVNMLSIVNKEPRTFGIKGYLEHFILHRKDVIVRRTQFDLTKAKDRSHILEGLIVALDDIDNAIKLIKQSGSTKEAKEALMTKYNFSEKQSSAILDMKLQKLTSLEQDKIRAEQKKLTELITDLEDILAREERVTTIIKDETRELIDKFGDDRRTDVIEGEDGDLEDEDLIEQEEMVVTITHGGYIKRVSVDIYKQQRRGGKGVIAATTKEDDFIEHVFVANTHNWLLFFTSDGRVLWKKVYKLPEGSRQARGKAIVNLLNLTLGTKITACIPVKSFDPDHFLVMATEKGVVKKTSLDAYSRPRQGGIIAINLNGDDTLVKVLLTDGEQQLLLATQNGMAVKFKEKDVRAIGRTGMGVRGIKLRGDDKVISMVKAPDDKKLLTITQNGFGKRTRVSDYRLISRGGSGVINIQTTERNGKVVAVRCVEEEDDIMFISRNGIIIRVPCAGISTIGRNTQGLRLMRMKDGDTVVSAAKIIDTGSDVPEEDVNE